MVRGSRVARQDIERVLTFLDSGTGEVVAQEHFGAKVVAARIEVEAAWVSRHPVVGVEPSGMRKSLKQPEGHLPQQPPARSRLFAAGLGKAPAGQDMRERYNILLRIAAIDSHRVEFHQIARIIFVDAFELPFGARAVRRTVLPVVQIEKHRGMPGGRAEQCAEFAQGIRTNRGFLEGAGPDIVEAFCGEHIEMVEPEAVITSCSWRGPSIARTRRASTASRITIRARTRSSWTAVLSVAGSAPRFSRRACMTGS